MRGLFTRHGPPLILKWNNGLAFVSQLIRQLTSASGVAPLLNPARRPQYNGALERSAGTLNVDAQL
jgi:transposase InsO family protein